MREFSTVPAVFDAADGHPRIGCSNAVDENTASIQIARNLAGQLDVKLGEIYFGAGDYQDASAAITRGLGKGQITQLDEAYVYLARDWMAQRNPTDAKKILAQLRALPNISPRVLRLWNLYADTIPEARSASL